MSNKKLRKGLSLLEVMIVLVILVGLMAVVGPRLLGTQKKADIRTAEVQVGNIVSALKQYAVDMKTFPTTEEGLELLVTAPEDEALARKWSGPYLEDGKIPSDPWGSPFSYEFETQDASSTGSDSKESASEFPRVFSLGPDKQSGTTDDISNRPAEGQNDDKQS